MILLNQTINPSRLVLPPRSQGEPPKSQGVLSAGVGAKAFTAQNMRSTAELMTFLQLEQQSRFKTLHFRTFPAVLDGENWFPVSLEAKGTSRTFPSLAGLCVLFMEHSVMRKVGMLCFLPVMQITKIGISINFGTISFNFWWSWRRMEIC